MNMSQLAFKEEVYKIVGLCMDVYNNLGFGFLEVVYKDAIQLELEENQIVYSREKEYPVFYKSKKLSRTFFADFLIFNGIIVEIKAAADGIKQEAVAQTLNYLKASKNNVGIIINFGKNKLEYKRLVL
jgi:GxxExxY protein